MLVSACAYVASATLLRQIGDGYSAFELTFLRSIIAVTMLAPFYLRSQRAWVWPERAPMLLLVAVVSYLGILFWFTAAARMPVAEFFALQFTTPLITIVLAVIFLRERADVKSWIATLIGFAGVLIVLRPGLIEFTFGAFAVLVSSAAYASVNTIIKSLSRTISPTGIVFYANLLLIPISMPMAIVEWRTPLLVDLPAIIGVGVLSTIGYTTVTRAISLTTAKVVQPVNFIRMPIAAVVGLIFFGEFPDFWTWAGAIIIFAATTYAIQHGSRDGPG
jgi:drug/metabolite transporter (DMT)-like permease